MRYARNGFRSAEEIIVAAHAGDRPARLALREYAQYLAAGITSIVQLLDPSLIVLAGGISVNNKILFAGLEELLPGLILPVSHRQLRTIPSTLGYYGAVYGAGALAREKVTIPQRFGKDLPAHAKADDPAW
jgi:glucokinase